MSFLRKQESSFVTNVLRDWIPAFAGMNRTGEDKQIKHLRSVNSLHYQFVLEIRNPYRE